METVNSRNNFVCLSLGEQWVERQAQFLAREPFGNGECAVAPLLVALLLVRRYGVVYLCLYAVGFEVLSQAVALCGHKGEYVEYVCIVFFDMRCAHVGVVYFFDVFAGYCTATVVILVEPAQFYAQYGCLKFVHSAVDACVVVYVFLVAAVVVERSYCVGKGGVVGGTAPASPNAPRFLPG